MKAHPISEAGLKKQELGELAMVLIDLHLEEPKKFNAELILQKLIDKYAALGFERIDA
jgi:L-rhamnose isomerase